MIPSIHKVPACPFTGLYTVSHCTDDHISCIYCTVRHTCTAVVGCEALFFFYVRAPAVLFQRGSFTVSPDFSFGLFNFLSHWTVTCLLGCLRCRGLMFDTHPYFFLSHSSHWSRLFMSPIDLMHGDFVLDFCALCNICHWVIVSPIKREEADYNKKIPWHLEYAWESWDILFFACYDSSQIVWLISLVGSEWDERRRSETQDWSSHFETRSQCSDHFWVCWVSLQQPWGFNDTSHIPFLKPLQ